MTYPNGIGILRKIPIGKARADLGSNGDLQIPQSRFSLGGNREGEIPDPIPNSEVKPFIADGTVRKSTEE